MADASAPAAADASSDPECTVEASAVAAGDAEGCVEEPAELEPSSSTRSTLAPCEPSAPPSAVRRDALSTEESHGDTAPSALTDGPPTSEPFEAAPRFIDAPVADDSPPTHPAVPRSPLSPPSPRAEGTATPVEPPIGAMACARCEQPVARADELLRERYGQLLSSAVFAYELEVLQRDVWVYSATNPGDERFDVCRFGTAGGAHVVVSGRPCAEHSWFPPHYWRVATCPGCRTHLGWAFLAEPDVNAPPCFVGLILTRLRERRVCPSELSSRPLSSLYRSPQSSFLRVLATLFNQDGQHNPAIEQRVLEAVQRLESENEPSFSPGSTSDGDSDYGPVGDGENE
ncbi:hypothetical protein AB1Y20_023104 [Prymnesium parvum]|uniref:CULT domain-containing protein n=1 Tax=Prymnesium parvum TaxID=97485 RepID=A0AB34JD42_PRYPA